jgi:hypothetical protein
MNGNAMSENSTIAAPDSSRASRPTRICEGALLGGATDIVGRNERIQRTTQLSPDTLYASPGAFLVRLSFNRKADRLTKPASRRKFAGECGYSTILILFCPVARRKPHTFSDLF